GWGAAWRRADHALRPGYAPGPREAGGAWHEASPCLRPAGWAGRSTAGRACSRGDRVREGGAHAGASAQPAGRNAGAARFFFEVGDGLLAVDDGLLEARELRKRSLPIALDDRSLRRIITIPEIG